MSGVPKKHHSKGKVGRRRSHHALSKLNIFTCKTCNAPAFPHRVCSNCGAYPKKERKPVTKASEQAPVVEEAVPAVAEEEATTQPEETPQEEEKNEGEAEESTEETSPEEEAPQEPESEEEEPRDTLDEAMEQRDRNPENLEAEEAKRRARVLNTGKDW